MRGVLRVVAWLVVLAAIGGGITLYLKKERARAAAEPKFRTAKVETGRISSKVTATGTLSARTTVQVGTQISGRIAELFVDFNSQVKKGQVLAKIDPRMLQATLQRTRATYMEATGALAKAKANAEQAKRAFERAKALKAEGLMGVQEYELAETAVSSSAADVLVAEARKDSAAASMSEAQVNLGFTTILSPIDGVILSKTIDVGQTVAASLQAPVLFTIAQDLRSIQVDTFVAEADVGKLETGMRATFTVDAFPGKRFEGKVREVRNAAQTVQNVVTYDAVLDVQNEKLELKPGMTANVTFVWAERWDVPIVPNAALRFRPPPDVYKGPPMKHDVKTVWKLAGAGVEPVTVVTGITDGTNTELVKTPLQTGDEIVIEYIVASPQGATSPAKPLGGGGGGGGGGRPRMF